MTDDFRKQVKIRLSFDKNLSQIELAEKLGVSRQYLNRVLNGRDGKMPDIWQAILEELDMTVMSVPLDKVTEVKKVLIG